MSAAVAADIRNALTIGAARGRAARGSPAVAAPTTPRRRRRI
jgi:hypothetical protein